MREIQVNNFVSLENEYLKIEIDASFGGKIVEILDKKIKQIGYGLIFKNIKILILINTLIMILNG